MLVLLDTCKAAVGSRGFRYLAAAAFLTVSATAPAAILQSITADTQYGYGFLGVPRIQSGSTASVRDGGSVAGFPAEFGSDFTATASNDGFFFLHNQYCVGRCSVFTLTTVTVTLHNAGDTAAAMRFDSQITPGHLARLGINDSSTATFDFDVTQRGNAGTLRTLYAADGIASAAGVNITTSDQSAFNGLTRYSNGDAWEVLDWSATNLNLLLDVIAPGETSTIVYRSLTRTSTMLSTCLTITDCSGVQVAFGDPRNDGGGANRATANFMLNAAATLDATALTPVIGRLFDAFKVPVNIVDATAPLPPTPPILPGVTYGAPFVSQVLPVPEPGTWAMMLLGFGMIGAVMRGHLRETKAAKGQ